MKKLFAALGVCFLLLLTSTSAHAERRIYSYTSYNTWNGEPLDIYVGANEDSGFVTGALEGAISCTVGVYEGDSYVGAPRFGRSPDGVWYAYDAELNRFMPLAYFNSELLNNVLRTVLSDEFQQAVREEIAEAETREIEMQRQEAAKQKLKEFKHTLAQGDQYRKDKKYAEAENAYISALGKANQNESLADYIETVTVKLAAVYDDQGKYVKVLELFAPFPDDKVFEHTEVYFLRAKANMRKVAAESAKYSKDEKLNIFRKIKSDMQIVIDRHPGGVMESEAKKMMQILQMIP